MARVVSLINMKGGVGKSTLTVQLAFHFAAYPQWFKNVLIVDLDPQFNATQYLLGERKCRERLQENKPTVWHVFEENSLSASTGQRLSVKQKEVIQRICQFSGLGLVDLIPSQLELSQTLRNPGKKEGKLKSFLDSVMDFYDLVLIDCAPTESVLTTAAYLCSDHILVPVRPEYLSTIGLPLLVKSLEDFSADYPDKDLGLAGVVFNAVSGYVPEEETSMNEVRSLAQKNGWHVFDSRVRYSKSYPKSSREGQPIWGTSYARTKTAENFLGFASDFARRIAL